MFISLYTNLLIYENSTLLEMFSSHITVLYCIVSRHLYSASRGADQSEALPVRETQREESSLERTKRGTLAHQSIKYITAYDISWRPTP